MRSRFVTQADIARATGVHRTTVSLALKHHPSIPEATRRHILETAERLGYRPDPLLTALASYRNSLRPASFQGSLAWLHSTASGYKWQSIPHYRDYFEGAAARAERHGFQLEPFDLNTYSKTPNKLLSIFRARNLQGVLICPQPTPHTHLPFALEQFAVVALGYSVLSPQVHVVTATQFRSTLQCMQQLIERGYQRIGFTFNPIHDSRADHNYLAGWLVSNFLSNRKPIPPYRGTEDNTDKIRVWYERYKPDAIITGNYQMIAVLKSAGISVPRDVGLACPLLPAASGQLSGVFEDSTHIGAVAVDTLVAMVQRGDYGIPELAQKIHVEGRWYEGTSLRKPKSLS